MAITPELYDRTAAEERRKIGNRVTSGRLLGLIPKGLIMRVWFLLISLWSNSARASSEPVPPWLLPSNLLPSDNHLVIAQGCEIFSVYSRSDVNEFISRTTEADRSWKTFVKFYFKMYVSCLQNQIQYSRTKLFLLIRRE